MAKSIRVDVDLSGAEQRFKELAESSGLLAEKLLGDATQYVPEESGDLKSSGHVTDVEPTRAVLMWSVPYAQRVYNMPGSSIKKVINPNASHHWFETAKSAHLEEWQHFAAELFERTKRV